MTVPDWEPGSCRPARGPVSDLGMSTFGLATLCQLTSDDGLFDKCHIRGGWARRNPATGFKVEPTSTELQLASSTNYAAGGARTVRANALDAPTSRAWVPPTPGYRDESR